MHKKDVLTVNQKSLNALAELNYSNNDFGVNAVTKHLFGNVQTKNCTNISTGSNFGLLKVLKYASYQKYRGTATLPLKELLCIGFAKNPRIK